MASTFTQNLNLEKPATGEQNNTWGGTVRNNWDAEDDAIRGFLAISVAGSSDVTLTQAQWRHHTLKFTGVLTGNINILFPDSREGCWWIENATTGAFTITCKTVSGSGVVIDQYTQTKITSDATDIDVHGEDRVGNIVTRGSGTVPSRYLECTGQAVSRTTYSKLFALYGTTFGVGDGSTTFNVPDLRGRSGIGVGTGDATNATAWTLGEKGGDETHTLDANQMQHTHPQPDHQHTMAHTHDLQNHTHTVSIWTGDGSGASPKPEGSNGTDVIVPAHQHLVSGNTGAPSTNVTGSSSAANTGLSGTAATGGVQSVTATAHNNMHPVLGLHFFVYAGQ